MLTIVHTSGSLILQGFEWDDGNLGKCRKHGVLPQEIEAIFDGTVHIAPDEKHSGQERRFLAIGRNHAGRYVFVAFTLRQRKGALFLRPISARYMHGKEIKRHEKESAALQDRRRSGSVP